MNNDFQILLSAAIDQAKAQNKLNDQIAKLKTEAIKLGVKIDDKTAKQAILSLSKEQDAFYKKNLSAIDFEAKKRQEQSKIASNQIKSQIQERIAAENKIQAEAKKTAKIAQDGLNLGSGRVQLNNNISAYLKNNTNLSKELQNQLINIQSRIKSVDKTQLNNLKNEFREVTSAAGALGQTGDNFSTRLVKNSMQLFNFLSSATLIMGSVNAIRNMVEDVKELDKSMISLRKVTDESKVSYEKFLDVATQKAKSLGSSISDVVNMTAEWAKAGYNLSDSTMLAEVSTIFTNVGDVDTATAVSDIVTPMKAFNLAASDAIKIVDKLNEVDNNFAVNSADIGTGLANSASALALAGNDINQSIALITGGSEITQNASETGNAVKVLSMRLRGRHYMPPYLEMNMLCA